MERLLCVTVNMLYNKSKRLWGILIIFGTLGAQATQWLPIGTPPAQQMLIGTSPAQQMLIGTPPTQPMPIGTLVTQRV